MPKLPYTPLGTNVLLRAENPKRVGGLIIPDNVQAPPKVTFELVAAGEQCEIVDERMLGVEVFVKPGGSVWPFPVDDAAEHVYYLAAETDLAAVVN